MQSTETIKKLVSIPLEVQNHIRQRILAFNKLKKTGYTKFDFIPYLTIKPYVVDIFSEACFCILTANFRADKSILMQKDLGIDLCRYGTYEQILNVLQKYGHRFAKQRASRIIDLQRKSDFISNISKIEDPVNARNLLIKEVSGYGLKEASHFLRNIGFKNIAIIDRHIFRFLIKQKYIPDKKTITPNIYLQAENVLQGLAKELGISVGALDLYIFYHQTGQVLK